MNAFPAPTLTEHLAAVTAAAERLASAAAVAGLETAVPTCPGWSVRDLVAHVGMVHRWATAHASGDSSGLDGSATSSSEARGRGHDDPVAWLREGAANLVAAIRAAPADLEALVFLPDAPPPREFWARRQCHETTVHAVDALSAVLGRTPSAAEADVPTAVALDGIDELLTGFIRRRRSRLRSDEPLGIGVRPRDTDAAWLVEVGSEAPVTTRHTSASLPGADVTFGGTAAQLYLGLWNRGEEIEADDADVLELWRRLVTVSWS